MAQTSEQRRNESPDPAHYSESSARENLIEHVFLGELLRGLWRKDVRDLEVLRPEVDSGGYAMSRFDGAGNRMVNSSPPPGLGRALMVAWWAWAMAGRARRVLCATNFLASAAEIG